MKRYIRCQQNSVYDVLFTAIDGADYDARTELDKIRNVLLGQGYSIVNQIYDNNRIVVKSVDSDEYNDLKLIFKDMESQYINDYSDYNGGFSFLDTEYPVAFRRVESSNADIESNTQMKLHRNYVRSARGYDFSGWRPEDVELWESIDWKARNYEEYPVEDEYDSFISGDITIYGIEDHGIDIPCTFQKVIRANPIYPPYYCVLSDDLESIRQDYPEYQLVGPMYDGNDYDGYQVHDRVETQELYDTLAD